MKVFLFAVRLAYVLASLDFILLVFNRPLDTIKLLHSLHDTCKFKMKVNLIIQQDRLPNRHFNRLLSKAIHKFKWQHGSKFIYLHKSHYGLRKQWLSVRPTEGSEAIFILEDDLILTPKWPILINELIDRLKMKDKDIFAATLQKPQWQMGMNEHGKWRRLDLLPLTAKHPSTFLFQAPATWGLLLLTSKWNEFLTWSSSFSGNSRRSGSITTKWAEQREDLISPLIFEYLLERNESILYLWSGRNSQFIKPIYSTHSSYELPLEQDMIQINWKDLPRYSACFDLIDLNYKEGPSICLMEGYEKVIHHLRNICRRSKVFLSAEGTDCFKPEDYQNDCRIHPNEPSIHDNCQLRCNYTCGLYPHYK